MKRQPWGLYAIALAILVVGLAWAGVSVGTVLISAAILVCPLMMVLMMHGRGHDQPVHHDTPDDDHAQA